MSYLSPFWRGNSLHLTSETPLDPSFDPFVTVPWPLTLEMMNRLSFLGVEALFFLSCAWFLSLSLKTCTISGVEVILFILLHL